MIFSPKICSSVGDIPPTCPNFHSDKRGTFHFNLGNSGVHSFPSPLPSGQRIVPWQHKSDPVISAREKSGPYFTPTLFLLFIRATTTVASLRRFAASIALEQTLPFFFSESSLVRVESPVPLGAICNAVKGCECRDIEHAHFDLSKRITNRF